MSENSNCLSSNGKSPAVPVAELMRLKNAIKKSNDKDFEKHDDEDIDLDDEIKRLEAELAEDSSENSESENESEIESSGSSGISIEESNQRRKKLVKFGSATILNAGEDRLKTDQIDIKTGVICTSECASYSILPLPKAALPTSKTRMLKIDKQGEVLEEKRRKRKRPEGNESGGRETNINEGLRDAVKEVLSGYVARSSEKIPFYCRVCSHQCSNEIEFIAHKKTEFHKIAIQMEKKATYCRLCKKQLTSIVQMKEHLKSRPHREKLEHVQARQRGFRQGYGNVKSGGGGNDLRQGRGDRTKRSEKNSIPPRLKSRRQWS